jgi:hypothetical protein
MRMDNSWEDFRKKFKTGISAVYRKADELTRIGKLRLEIVAVKRDIEKAFIEMGGRLYHQISEESRYDTKDDPQIEIKIYSVTEIQICDPAVLSAIYNTFKEMRSLMFRFLS